MIIECPKCKARFEVPLAAFKFALQRFSCATCGFVFTAARPRPLIYDDEQPIVKPAPKPAPARKEEQPDARQLLRSLGLGEPVGRMPEIFTQRNIMFSLLGIAVVFAVTFLALYIPGGHEEPPPPQAQSSTASARRPAREQPALYIEVVKNLTVIREGSNEFVPLSGYIFNPGREAMPVPRLVVRIESRNGQLLQEQEHDPPVKLLGPGEKADFNFKIFKFSDKMSRFIVEFDEGRGK
jgi:predicted Zn finger-like uncharacterized protein